MYPPTPKEYKENSLEGIMFDAFKRMSDDYMVFHSMTITTVEGDIIEQSEMDFVVFHPKKGIICIEAKNLYESRTAYELIRQNRGIVTKELSHVIDRDAWCKGNVDKFKFYVPEVDDQYSVKTIFLTYHENAYKYFEHDKENDITFLSSIEIVENPMSVFV